MGPDDARPASVDDYVAAFEAAWSRDGGADLARFLPPAGHPLHRDVLRELVCVDLELGWDRGRPRPLAAYLKLYPELAADPDGLRRAAFEEYRQRQQAGQLPDPAEYETRLGVPTADWFRPGPADDLLSGDEFGFVVAGHSADGRAGPAIPSGPTRRPPVELVPVLAGRPDTNVPALLRRRLRLLSLGVAAALAYSAGLVLTAPTQQKVGLFLERPSLVALNWVMLAACGALAAVLWSRRRLSYRRLRRVEVALVGLLLAEMGAGLFADLILDDELRQPLAEGDHALFHYAGSWSLPFFALIVGYGTLIPNTARRCAIAVAVMAAVPLAIGGAAGLTAGVPGPSFVRSFLLQMGLWMAAAAAVAWYGASRVETLRREVSVARRVGQYRLARRLGAGGMGEVYLAEHVLLRRPCAVKVIRREIAAEAEALRRFEREARAAAALTHPNTVQVFDYGAAADGTFYLAMEYLPGPDLDRLVARDGPLPPGRVVRLLRQACGALGEAHRVGLVHRDVKPSNILVCDRGGVRDVVKLVDFGLAHGADGANGGRDRPPQFVGTPAYASPEQAGGRADPDPRSDVYSLGAVGYFLLTGKAPFGGGSELETLSAVLHEPVIPPRSLWPDVPEDVEAVVLRCLEKDPDRRFPDAGSLERALAGCGSAAG